MSQVTTSLRTHSLVRPHQRPVLGAPFMQVSYTGVAVLNFLYHILLYLVCVEIGLDTQTLTIVLRLPAVFSTAMAAQATHIARCVGGYTIWVCAAGSMMFAQ